jgi:CheY-like chemotaxis protein
MLRLSSSHLPDFISPMVHRYCRRSTRISVNVPFTLAGINRSYPFAELSVAILVNPQGCAAKFDRPLEIGTTVRLENLPAKHAVTGRVVNCFWPGEFAKFWIVGLALDEPGNVWGVETPPEDWNLNIPASKVEGTSSLRPLILCLEDNESYLRLRKAVLEKNGYTVIGVSTGNDALRVLRDAPVCLVISDHLLRGATGSDLAGELKRIKPEIPVILYSGQQPDKLENIDVYINKNTSTQDFLAQVRDLVKGSSG